MNEDKGKSPNWLTPTVFGIALTSFFSDLSHETATSILPMFLAGIGAAPAALGIIEGCADAVSSFAKLGSGWYSDRLHSRKPLAVWGYVLTAVSTGTFATATTWLHVLLGRTMSWFGRGIRGPVRDALMTDAIPPDARGRAFGFERAMDTLGAVLGPAAALWLITFLPHRTIFYLTLIPGFLAVASFAFLVRGTRREILPPKMEFLLSISELPKDYRRYLAAIGIFGIGDFAHSLLILRAGQMFAASGRSDGPILAVTLYGVHNVVYAAASYPAGAIGDMFGKKHLLVFGYGLSVVMCIAFIFAPANFWILAAIFSVAGLYMAIEDSLEKAIAADFIQPHLRGTGFGMLATVNGLGDFVSSIAVGLLWSTVSPNAGFIFAAVFSLAGMIVLTTVREPGKSL